MSIRAGACRSPIRHRTPPPPLPYGPAALPDQAPAPVVDPRYASFGAQAGAVKWEVGGILAYMTATQALVTKETTGFHFQDEGWFGRNTTNLGVDKLTHAYNSYLLTELLTARIERKAGPARGAAVTAAVLASGLMAYSELWDAHKVSSGFSRFTMSCSTPEGPPFPCSAIPCRA